MSRWFVHLSNGNRRNGVCTTVEADDGFEAAGAAWAKCGRADRPVVASIRSDSSTLVFRTNDEILTASRMT